MRAFLCLVAILIASSPSGAGEPARDAYLAPLPQGALARLGMRIDTANNVTYAASAESPDGKLLATAVDRNILVWDRMAGRVIHNFVAHPYKLRNLVFNGNDTLLSHGYEGSKDAVKEWNARAGKLRRSIAVPENWAGSAFSRDGKLLALTTPGAPNTLHVWDITAGKELFTDKEHYPHVFFSWDNRHVITSRQHRIKAGQYDTIVTFRHARTGKIMRKLTLADQQTTITDICADGKLLVGHTHVPHAVQSKWRTHLRLFDAETGNMRRTLLEQRSGDLKSAVFSPDGSLVAAVNQNESGISVWDVQSGRKRQTFSNGHAFFNYPRFARDGKTLVNTTAGGRVFVYDLRAGTTRDWNPTHRGPIACLAYTPDGKHLASASSLSEIFLWETMTGKLLQRLEVTPAYDGNRQQWEYANKMAFAPDGKHLLVQQSDQSVRLFAPFQGKEVHAFRMAGHVWGFSEGGRHLLWTGAKLDLLHRMHNTPKTVAPDVDYCLGCLRWVALCNVYPELKQFRCFAYFSPKLPGEMPRREFNFGMRGGAGATTSPCGLSPDGSIMADWTLRLAGQPFTGMGTYWVRDGIRLSDRVTGQEIIRVKEPPLGTPLYFAPDSRSFVALTSGPKSGLRMMLHETRTGKLRRAISDSPAQYGGVAFSRDGRLLAFVTANKAIDVFDFAQGKVIASLPHKNVVKLVFSPKGDVLAASDHSHTIVLWDMKKIPNGAVLEPEWKAAEKDRTWADLAHADSATAFEAMMRLQRQPTAAVALMRARLGWRQSSAELAKMIASLGSEVYATRKKASDAIEQLGERARPGLERARADAKSLEHKRRIEDLLGKLATPFSTPAGLRLLRAIEVLDSLQTAGAAKLLREIAAEAPADDPLAREVARALRRWR